MTPRKSVTLVGCVCGDPNCIIPYGDCHCGCGKKAAIAKGTSIRDRLYKGFPAKHVKGHSNGSRVREVGLEGASHFKIDGVYCRLIYLSSGQYTIVWESDYDWLMQWKWNAYWNRHTKGYYAARTKQFPDGRRTTVWMHRAIMGFELGDKPTIDHKRAGDTLDNRRSNLRIATSAEQTRNQRTPSDNTSGVKGVCWDGRTKRWRATITVNYKTISLGNRKNIEDAAALYRAAQIKYHGEFANFD